MNENTIRRAVERADRAAGYEQAIEILFAAGVRVYYVDVRSHVIVYSSDLASYTDAGEAAIDAEATPSNSLQPEDIEMALRAIDRGEADYRGFLGRLWQAGVVEYEVNLIWRRMAFYGAHGQSFVSAVAAHEKELVRA